MPSPTIAGEHHDKRPRPAAPPDRPVNATNGETITSTSTTDTIIQHQTTRSPHKPARPAIVIDTTTTGTRPRFTMTTSTINVNDRQHHHDPTRERPVTWSTGTSTRPRPPTLHDEPTIGITRPSTWLRTTSTSYAQPSTTTRSVPRETITSGTSTRRPVFHVKHHSPA